MKIPFVSSGLILVALGGCTGAMPPSTAGDPGAGDAGRGGAGKTGANVSWAWLEKRAWQLEQAESGVLAKFGKDTGITLVFAGDARLRGNSGCNHYDAQYRIEGDRLVLGPVAATKMFCEGERGQIEDGFLALLSQPLRLAGDEKQLRLIAGEDEVVLHFVPAQEAQQ